MWPRLPLTKAAQGAGALNPKPYTVLSGRPPSASTYSATIRPSGASPLAPIATPSVSSTICLISSTSSCGSASNESEAACCAIKLVTPLPSSRAIPPSRLGREVIRAFGSPPQRESRFRAAFGRSPGLPVDGNVMPKPDFRATPFRVPLPTQSGRSPLLLDNLVGAGEHRLRHREAERLGGLKVDDQLERRRLLDQHLGGLGAPEDLSRVNRRNGM